MAKSYASPLAQTARIGIATFTSTAAITSRANITGTTGLVQLTPVYTEDKRVDMISWKAKGSSVAGTIFLWMYNGTTSFLNDEFICAAATATTTAPSDYNIKPYQGFTIPIGYQLFVSNTILQDYNVFAFGPDF